MTLRLSSTALGSGLLLGIGLFALVGSSSPRAAIDAEPTVSSESAAQLVVDRSELVLNRLEGRWYYADAPFEGRAQRRAEDGQLLESVPFSEGKKHGEAVYYHPGGEVRRRVTYVMNRFEGQARAWSRTGLLVEESNYSNGRRHGVQRMWHPNGQLAKERNLVDGQERGMQRAWMPNGKIYVNYEYKDGRRYGLKRSTLCLGLEDEVVSQ